MPYQPAILGSARLNNFRLGYQSAALAAIRATRVNIVLAGVFANPRVRMDGLTIHDALNEAPNTCRLTVDGTAPLTGQDLRITVNSDTPVLLFNGTLQTVDQSYEGKPSQLAWACTAVDDTARANRKRPFGTWTNVSATTIAAALVTTYAPGFTATHIEAGLPTVSIIFDGSQTFSGCLAQLAQLIGGYFYWEDLDLHFFLTEATNQPDDLDSTPLRFLDDPPIKAEADDSQMRTRVYGKGHGEGLSADVAASETILPIDDAVMFNANGGQAIAGTTPDGAQSQILTYTGVQLRGVGSLVGPGAAPSVAPTMAAAAGTGVDAGVHQGAYTFVTGAGESLPSPLGTVTTGVMTPPIGCALNGPSAGGSLGNGVYQYAITFVTAGGETTPSAISTLSTDVFGDNTIDVVFIPIGPSGTTARNVYRTVVNGSQLKLLVTIADNTTTTRHDTAADGTLGANAPSSNTAVTQQIVWTGIALGPSGTTSRKVYRTAAGGAQLKLQQTIADNTTTTGVTDSTADGSLGANAPTSDTSGLTQPVGQVNAGSTSLVTAGWAFATAGWVQIGSQLVRYTGVTGNTLTGIPASGPGALGGTVLYGDPVTAAPAVTGVTGNSLAMLKGTSVHLWVQRNDLAAQAALVVLDAAQGRVSDGVVEGQPIVDERRGEASLMALCDADLALFSRPLATVTYATRDIKTKSGKPIVVNLTSPLISETLTIQEVTIDQIDIAPRLRPRFRVVASNVRFSLEDVLRQLLTKAVA